jgi:glutamine cyclotransferase
VEEIGYDREGWGICAVDGYVVTSDGSGELVRRDPGNLASFDVIHVRREGVLVRGLNDLTCSAGTIWANIIGMHLLAGIDAASGEVTDVVDARAARERHRGDEQAIMNGVAALPVAGEFLLTGKTYRHIRHVRLVPGRTLAARLAPGSLSLAPKLDGLSV